MNKKIVSLAVSVSLFAMAGLALGQTLTAPAGVPTDFSALLKQIATAVGELIASLGGIMLIIAGILFLTSAGSPEKMGVAKKALTYAIIGIVIGLAATTIVNIIQDITGFAG